MSNLNNLNIKIFLDTANLDAIKKSLTQYPFIKGFTTNPSLMHKEGVKDYEKWKANNNNGSGWKIKYYK